MGLWPSWRRWWYSPLLVSLPGVALCVGLAVERPYGPDVGWELWIILTVLFGVLLPMVMACVGVGARRAFVFIWDRSLSYPDGYRPE